jgi:ankyrin repeat protein
MHSGEDNITPDAATALLFVAARYGLVDAAQIAIEHGADIRDDGAWADKLMPIHVAAASGHASVIELLVRHGVSPNVASGYYGMRPLHFAAMSGRTATIEALIGLGANVTARSAEGTTAVQFASDAQSRTSVDALVRAGAKSLRDRSSDSDSHQR